LMPFAGRRKTQTRADSTEQVLNTVAASRLVEQIDMGVFFDLLLVLALALWLIRAGLTGSVSVGVVALALVALTVLIALGRAMRIGLVRTVFRIGVPIATLAAFVAWEGDGNPALMSQTLGGVLLLLLVLAGIYFMVKGVLGRPPRR
ncbi:MAG TPA: hypothetical protein VFT23_13865, partial [Burkholderiales bacterium]|nr:hypothetical protein [Burkholderiales bacterium]